MKTAVALLALAAALAAATPALGREQESIGHAMIQPLRDLSIMRKDTPDILLKAVEAPYAPAGDCKLMAEEIADLDAVLGDDMSSVNNDGSNLVTSVVRSAVKLPFGSVIRRISGAHKRDQAYEDALIAGVARRGFLKGAMTACTAAPPLVPEIATLIPLVPELAPSQMAAIPPTDAAVVVAAQ